MARRADRRPAHPRGRGDAIVAISRDPSREPLLGAPIASLEGLVAHASGTWLEGKLLAGKEKLTATFDQQDVCTSLHLRYERGRPGVWVWDPAAFVALATGRVVTLRKGRDHELLSWREGPHLVSVEYGPEGIESLRIETK